MGKCFRAQNAAIGHRGGDFLIHRRIYFGDRCTGAGQGLERVFEGRRNMVIQVVQRVVLRNAEAQAFDRQGARHDGRAVVQNGVGDDAAGHRRRKRTDTVERG